MEKSTIPVFYPKTPAAWRKWLEKNHSTKEAVWLVFYTRQSAKKTISWSEAVDVALCFGWIDSKKIRIDDEMSHQFFSRRKPNSTWSKINKAKVEKLIESGEMRDAGYQSIERAKGNGSWTLLDEVEELLIPPDLEKSFSQVKGAKDYFLSLSKSAKKAVLQWIVLAKRPETRQSRIAEVARLAGKEQKPSHIP